MGRLAQYVRDARVPLEMCPTSNVHTGAVASIGDHPIDLLRRLRFRVTLNTDNRLMSGVTLSSELGVLARTFGVGLDEMQWLTLNAMKSSFLAVRRAPAAHQRRHQARLRATDGGGAGEGPDARLAEARRGHAARSSTAGSSGRSTHVPQVGHW